MNLGDYPPLATFAVASGIAAYMAWPGLSDDPRRRGNVLMRSNTHSGAGRGGADTAQDMRRLELKKTAEETLTRMEQGYFTLNGVDYDLRTKVFETRKTTTFIGPDDELVKAWAVIEGTRMQLDEESKTHISILNISTLDAARLLDNMYKMIPSKRGRTGILNFASATKPGGGFKSGAEAQEESIARSSTLYASLKTDEAARFYKLHSHQKETRQLDFYTHAMIYSPKVTIFRDDDGMWTQPFQVDVLSCAAVNAGEVLKKSTGFLSGQSGMEVEIEKEMKERMGRILFLFEQQQVRNLVLGTFGTGVFRNKVAMVARIWAHLLLLPDARFRDSFDRIIFAITGEETFADFHSAFEAWGQPRRPAKEEAPRGSAWRLPFT